MRYRHDTTLRQLAGQLLTRNAIVNDTMTLEEEVRNLCADASYDVDIRAAFLKRLDEGSLTREEDPVSHICAYFPAFDPERKEVFIGHHKKSGLWLFNGGHIDPGETLRESVMREIGEEWGIAVDPASTDTPFALYVTTITQSVSKRPCKYHFDIWFKVPLDKEVAHFDVAKLATEFHEAKWMTIPEAFKIASDPSTRAALSALERA